MHLLKELSDWYARSLESGGYPLIVLLMFIESTFLPLPSEVIIPPAAHLAHSQGNLSVTGVIIAGTLGSWLGATTMYWIARLAGRPLVLKVSAAIDQWAARRLGRAPLLLNLVRHAIITPEKVGGVERWSAAYGNFGIFASRLLPVVRHLIGIPAGVVRMDFRWYSLYTLLGSGLWCCVLCWLGIEAGENQALMNGELHAITLWAVGILAVLGFVYWFFVHRHMQAARK
ncbi:MAG TPA: DedA family protein [Candidatus Didemnitutus sp.]|jgi:membrane protein DedA with SNARE-associated domain